VSAFPSLNGRMVELEKLLRWRRRIDWLRRAAQAQHPRVLERGSLDCYSYDELEQLEGAGQERSPARRLGYEHILAGRRERGNACVQRYLAGIRRTAARDLGDRTLAPAVHILVRSEGYTLPAAMEEWGRIPKASPAAGYHRAWREAMESPRR
jgi:hypothetical protein